MSFFDFSQAHTRRSLTLLAAGALIGLGIAGYGLFTARGTATRGIPPEARATVNGRLILQSDYITQLQAQFGIPYSQSTPQQRQRVLDDMIGEELMVQRGLEADLPSYDPEVRQALVNGVELQIYADVLALQPSEQQLQDYYTQHKAKYVRDGIMQLRDLMLAAPVTDAEITKATEAAKALKRGTAVEKVISEYGLKDSRRLLDSGNVDTGDVFDFSAKARLDPQVFAAAEKLGENDVSEPIKTTDGVHVVAMFKRQPPRQRDYTEVSNEVWADLKKDAQDKVRAANLAYLRSKADVRIAESP